jgi:peptidoglycan/xylan/chitin deacetylase (PgdA/CDA1 family)
VSTRVRWIAKKCARATVALGSGRRAGSGGGEARLRVLTYHRFGSTPRDPFCVTVEDFARQMAWLAEHRLAVSLADLEGFVEGRARLADGCVVVTIDDACPSLFSHALPVLRRHAIPAVAFVPAGELRAGGEAMARADDESRARLAWSQLDALLEAGLTVGSHGWTHRSLARLSAAEAREEAERSRAALEQRTGQPVTSFAYPFGTRADYNATTASVLRAAGYRTAFTSQHGAIRPGTDALELPRVKVEGGEGWWMFRRLLDGGLDAWRWVDRSLWRLQAAGG